MGKGERKAYLAAIQGRYRKATRAQKSKILAFTVEFGEPLTDDEFTANGFQPSMIYEMPWIVEDLTGGTMGFCLAVKTSVPSEWMRWAAVALAALGLIIVIIIRSCQ